MKQKQFVHLHLHSQYSLLDGAILVSDLMEKLKSQGVKAAAITDHGTMHGIVDFYTQALKNNIKPIIGCEVYVAPDDRKNRNYSKQEDKNYHLILLAKNNKGLKNLQKLVSIAQLEGFYYKPRIDKEVLQNHSEGLIGLSACLAGEPQKHILNNDFKKAKEAALEYRDILGKDDYYLELQENGMAEQKIVNKGLINISRETDIPLVASNDCHYLNKGDDKAHQILMCIQMQETISSTNKLEIHSDQLYVKSPEEMWEAFAEVPEACENTLNIAERCNVSLNFDDLHLPEFDIPEGYSANSYFEHIAKQGLHKKLADIPADKHKAYYERLNRELEIIKMRGYAGYYLIVWDFINYARENNIPVGPGRGSGAGSLAAYAMGITDIDPIRFNLLFERFLNPERESMPDFDIDFCMNKREQVIKYVVNKYGDDRVAQIVTFGKLLARGVIRDVGRVLEIPLKTVDKIAKLIPEKPNMTLKKALKEDPDLKNNIESVENGRELLEHALKLEGLLRNAGMHAAGIVISDKPLVEYVPLCKGQNNEVVTQFEKNTLEKVGLVKFDFLGLKNLTVIDEAVQRVNTNNSTKLDINKIPLDDKKTYEMLSSGNTTGVFQLESTGMRNLLKKIKPTTFEDIIALVALYRPGPIGSGMLDDFVKRKHGTQEISYILPELEPILKETYGIIVYQEQVMQIAQEIGGYSLGNADLLRRAMGKKKPEEMKKHKQIFLYGDKNLGIEGAKGRGYDLEIAENIFSLMEKFAEYGFNKSHSAAYAMVAYQTAYLKTHHPIEYMAALMTCELDKGEKVVSFIEECKRMGIEVLPPDINKSCKDFTIDDGSIRFGLGALKNVGYGAIDCIVEERENNGPFKSIYDVCKRVDLRQANKKVFEALIKAGALDDFGKNRRQLLQVLETAIDLGQKKQKYKKEGVVTIDDLLKDANGDDDDEDEFYPDVEEMPENELLKFEKEILGFYITNHPLSTYSAVLDLFSMKTTELSGYSDDTQVTLGGIVKAIKTHITKKGERMAFVTLEDIEGTIDLVVFPSVFREHLRNIEEDRILIVKGKYNSDEEKESVLVEEIYEINEAIETLADSLLIKLNMIGFTEERLNKLKNIITRYQGTLPVKLEIDNPTKYKLSIEAGENFAVKPSLSLFKQIEDLLGSNTYEIMLKAS
ncbi:DNA polymerase III subunit alpha [Flexistipes sinusarabici]|uniref:DNA polymerase III subunit alpha n=1 Tax=Flexistipes sinusarabici TaxID=2352 RepID=UPI002354E720|nr:DNA polymerase III subunit alpha [Flexistipes sinusarabici]